MKHIPNLISVSRLLGALYLIWFAHLQESAAFGGLLLLIGATDWLDGWLARRYGWTSSLGALLDSVADITLVVVTLYGIWLMHPAVFIIHGWVIGLVVAIWSVVHSSAFLRYAKLASFHTYLTQVGIFLFGIFALSLFFFGFVQWLYYLAGFVCFLGGIESLIMIALLPGWKPDLRGGIVTVLRER